MEDAGTERQPLLGGSQTHTQTQRQYEAVEQVKCRAFQDYQIPFLFSSSADQVAVRLDSGSNSADRSWSTEEGEAGDSAGEQTSTINIDEPAPKSYVCLGYIFSIIAGLCFTSW